MNYNLLEEQWIPVLMTDGKYCRVGIKDALTQAGRIRQIAASNPMDRVALLPFLVAVLQWCTGSPAEGERGELFETGQFPVGWFAKLQKPAANWME
ncbi:type I-E CRISPR-associated protein Cse1/CasA [bacterium]|nr:type I-E CRISPR-associated protein Cse1/CasA [bacterium]